MVLWVKVESENEIHTAHGPRAPGPEWQALERDPGPGEAVRVIEGRAQIVPLAAGGSPVEAITVDQRRAALAAALLDILLAVAEGADLAEEVRKVIGEAKGGANAER